MKHIKTILCSPCEVVSVLNLDTIPELGKEGIVVTIKGFADTKIDGSYLHSVTIQVVDTGESSRNKYLPIDQFTMLDCYGNPAQNS